MAHTSGVASVAPTPGTARAFSKTIYDAAGRPRTSARARCPKSRCTSPQRTRPWPRLSPALRPIAARVKGTNQGAIIGGADVYVSDFGAMTHVPHYMMAGSTLVYDLIWSEIKMTTSARSSRKSWARPATA